VCRVQACAHHRRHLHEWGWNLSGHIIPTSGIQDAQAWPSQITHPGVLATAKQITSTLEANHEIENCTCKLPVEFGLTAASEDRTTKARGHMLLYPICHAGSVARS